MLLKASGPVIIASPCILHAYNHARLSHIHMIQVISDRSFFPSQLYKEKTNGDPIKRQHSPKTKAADTKPDLAMM